MVFSLSTENKSAVTASSSTESNLNHGIFLNDKLFKNKNSKKSLSKSKSKNAELANNTTKKSTPPATKTTTPTKTSSNNQSTGNNANTKVINGPILQKGWVKYFKYSGKLGNGVKHPDSFKENKQFYEQSKFFPNSNLKEKKDGIFEFIRDPHFFFLHLFEQIITLNSSLHDKERRIIDQLSIYDINEIYEDSKQNKSNGILEYGKFNEGYCLKICTRDQWMTIFIICTETEGDRTSLFNKIRALKINDQHLNGIFKFEHVHGTEKETLSDLFGNKKHKIDNNNSPKDGYWITLQEWSQCSKKCDSGTSTFQRMCIPAKKGGKPCKGDALLVKPCNRQPCPKVTSTSETMEEKKKNTTILKPIVKIMPFTNHPQRFTLCKIKESDMMIFDDGKDPIKQNEPLFRGKDIDAVGGIRIPSRVVMNPKTISIFAGDEFETLYLSFSIKKTKFFKVKNRKNCFKLYETVSRYTTLCPYNADVSPKEFEEWETDFLTFRDKCSRPSKDLEGKEEKELQNKIKDRMEKAKQQAIAEANEERKTKKAEINEDSSTLVKETNTIAMKAIQKESNLEELIKQEAEEKNKAEEIVLRKQIEMEKKKQTCVVKAIREKELENQMQEKAKEINETINTIKTEAATQVIRKRNNLKKLINEINKKAEFKRNRLRQQLQQVRMSIASDLGKAYRKGDITKCTKAFNNPKARNDYCIATFSEDFAQMNFCKETDDFCETCCQAEFGEMNETEKDNCLKKVCNKKTNGAEDNDDLKEKNDTREISNSNGKGFIKQRGIIV